MASEPGPEGKGPTMDRQRWGRARPPCHQPGGLALPAATGIKRSCSCVLKAAWSNLGWFIIYTGSLVVLTRDPGKLFNLLDLKTSHSPSWTSEVSPVKRR